MFGLIIRLQPGGLLSGSDLSGDNLYSSNLLLDHDLARSLCKAYLHSDYTSTVVGSTCRTQDLGSKQGALILQKIEDSRAAITKKALPFYSCPS